MNLFGWLRRLRTPQATECCTRCKDLGDTVDYRITAPTVADADAIVRAIQQYARRNDGLGGVHVR